MCSGDKLDFTTFYREVGGFYEDTTKSAKNLIDPPDAPEPIPPPKPPTKTAEKVYGAKAESDEPQLLGTNALQIPLKTIQ